jgi:ABC-type antimicrobial peptide transport system permease subunit
MESARLVGLGAIVGLGLAAIVTKPLALFLVPGQATSDPLTMSGTLLILLVVSLIAAWWPVRAALRVDPSITLRQE